MIASNRATWSMLVKAVLWASRAARIPPTTWIPSVLRGLAALLRLNSFRLEPMLAFQN
jgi:hypothetical protein